MPGLPCPTGQDRELLGDVEVEGLGADERIDELGLARLGRRLTVPGMATNASRKASMPVPSARLRRRRDDRRSGEMGGAGVECREQVEALDAASRALRPPARLDREDDRRLTVPLDEPRGDDPNHPKMLALAGDDDRRSIAESSESCEAPPGSGRDLALGLPSLVIGDVELARSPRPAPLVGQHQLDAGIGAIEAPRGVEAWPEQEGNVAFVDQLRLDAGGLHQRRDAGPRRAPDRLEPAASERCSPTSGTRSATVASATRSRSRIGASGSPLERRAPGRAWRRPRPAEHLERVAADLRMDDRAVGQRLAGLVVVGRPPRPGRLDRCDLGGRGDPAVDRHQQTAPALLERLQRGRASPVPPARRSG